MIITMTRTITAMAPPTPPVSECILSGWIIYLSLRIPVMQGQLTELCNH